MSERLPLVLCAEDEESDAKILKRTFAKVGVGNPLFIVENGQDVVDYLSGSPPMTTAKRIRCRGFSSWI